MRMIRVVYVSTLLLAGWIANGFTQEIGDPQEGFRIADDVCAECHAITVDGQGSVNPNAPPFKVIANKAGMTDMALRTWFQTPHPTMPNFIIKTAEAAALIAYIRSLKTD
jgi:mono/diheme cytochrome c family protein